MALLANVVGTHRSGGRTPDARIGHVLGAYLWLVAFPPFAGVSDLLTVVGFALVGAAWGRFVLSLWRSLVGTPRPPDRRTGDPSRPGREQTTE